MHRPDIDDLCRRLHLLDTDCRQTRRLTDQKQLRAIRRSINIRILLLWVERIDHLQLLTEENLLFPVVRQPIDSIAARNQRGINHIAVVRMGVKGEVDRVRRAAGDAVKVKMIRRRRLALFPFIIVCSHKTIGIFLNPKAAALVLQNRNPKKSIDIFPVCLYVHRAERNICQRDGINERFSPQVAVNRIITEDFPELDIVSSLHRQLLFDRLQLLYSIRL